MHRECTLSSAIYILVSQSWFLLAILFVFGCPTKCICIRVWVYTNTVRDVSPPHTEFCFYILLTHVYIIYMYIHYKHRDLYIIVLVQFCFPQRKQLLYLMSSTITQVVMVNYESRQDKEFLSPWLQPSSVRWGWQLGLWGSRQCFQHTLCAPALSRVGCPWGRLSLDMKQQKLPAEAW